MSKQKNENDKDFITRLALIIGVTGGFFRWPGSERCHAKVNLDTEADQSLVFL